MGKAVYKPLQLRQDVFDMIGALQDEMGNPLTGKRASKAEVISTLVRHWLECQNEVEEQCGNEGE